MLLEDQDRSCWDQAKISEGVALVEQVWQTGGASSYGVQGAIAALHARAASVHDTDWAQIAALYGVLGRMRPSPVVELNRAVAVAMVEGFEPGLALLDTIDLPGYHLLAATRADFLRRLGRRQEAATFYRQALALVTSDAERRFLERRLAEVTSPLA